MERTDLRRDISIGSEQSRGRGKRGRRAQDSRAEDQSCPGKDATACTMTSGARSAVRHRPRAGNKSRTLARYESNLKREISLTNYRRKDDWQSKQR